MQGKRLVRIDEISRGDGIGGEMFRIFSGECIRCHKKTTLYEMGTYVLCPICRAHLPPVENVPT